MENGEMTDFQAIGDWVTGRLNELIAPGPILRHDAARILTAEVTERFGDGLVVDADPNDPDRLRILAPAWSMRRDGNGIEFVDPITASNYADTEAEFFKGAVMVLCTDAGRERFCGSAADARIFYFGQL